MAITVGAVTGAEWNLAPGLKVKVCTVTMDGSYNGSGESVDFSTYFPNKVYGAIPCSDQDGWLLTFEPGAAVGPASGKMYARNTTSTLHKALFPHCDAATNLTGVVGTFVVIGN